MRKAGMGGIFRNREHFRQRIGMAAQRCDHRIAVARDDRAAIARINTAARSNGIATAVLSTAALAPLRAAQGFRMISVFTDSIALAAAANASLDAARVAIAEGSNNA